MAPADVATIRRDVSVVFPITPAGNFMNVYLINMDGSKLSHYHGRGGDCWGQTLKFPERWDKTIGSLGRLAYQIQATLSTINLDSLMQHEPTGMPHEDALMERATRLGEEGRVDNIPATEEARPASRWAGRRT